MSMSMLFGRTTLIVGVEDGPDGTTLVYVGQRGRGDHFVIPAGDPEGPNFRRQWDAAWSTHLFAPIDGLADRFEFVRGVGA